MKNKLYTQMFVEYQKGFSLQQVGKMFGMSRQSVYAGFKIRGYELRKIEPLPFLTFDGIKFTLRNNGYYARTDGDRELMHRYVWRYFNDDIPPNHDIHHRNHDRTDNKIENLELMSKSDHARQYGTKCNGVVHRCGR